MNPLINNLIRLNLLLLIIFPVLISVQCHATSLSDSILKIPKGTVFELHNELDIPANQNFVILGRDMLSESFNSVNQELNKT